MENKDTTTIEIQDIKRMNIRPGDVILVRLPVQKIHQNTLKKFTSFFEESFPNTKMVITNNDVDVSIISDQEEKIDDKD